MLKTSPDVAAGLCKAIRNHRTLRGRRRRGGWRRIQAVSAEVRRRVAAALLALAVALVEGDV